MLAFFMSSVVMLISAKYAWYIIVLALILALLNDRKRWKTYVVTLLLPTVLIHGGIVFLADSGAIISGDPHRKPRHSAAADRPRGEIQSTGHSGGRGLEARADLQPRPNGRRILPAGRRPGEILRHPIQKVSYKWRTVTKEDMENFNKAWLEIVKANPVIALDAFFAECFGYFDVTDLTYVSMDYYVNNDYVQEDNDWIHLYNHGVARQSGRLRQTVGENPGVRLVGAWQPVCDAHATDRCGRGGAASLAFVVVASAVATAHGRDDHRAGE